MLFIYKEKTNKILRNALKPFARFIPLKYRFPVNGNFTIDIGKNMHINLTCNPTSYLSRLLFWGGEKGFEYKTVRIYKELVKEAHIIFDIGSNIGYYSLLGAKINPQAKVYAFEPMPAAFKYLKINIKNNNLTSIYPQNVALSNAEGKALFFAVKSKKFMDIEDHLNGDGTINENNNLNSSHQFEVSTITLDSFCRSHNIEKIDVIKIDTEASEHLVFEGAMNMLKKARPVIFCEVIPHQIENQLNNLFEPLQYSFFKAYPDGLKKFDTLTESYDSCIDYVLVPNEKIHIISRFIQAS